MFIPGLYLFLLSELTAGAYWTAQAAEEAAALEAAQAQNAEEQPAEEAEEAE